MDSPFMAKIANLIAGRGIRVVRFEFPYMAARREGKKSGAPDRQPVLIEAWKEVIRLHAPSERLVIGGKSLGGRIASLVADDAAAGGLVCFGYPFHPPGQPEKLRTAHLQTLKTRALIIQGERDPFGSPAEVGSYQLSPLICVEWMKDGDHSLRPRASSGVTERENLERAAALAAGFILRP